MMMMVMMKLLMMTIIAIIFRLVGCRFQLGRKAAVLVGREVEYSDGNCHKKCNYSYPFFLNAFRHFLQCSCSVFANSSSWSLTVSLESSHGLSVVRTLPHEMVHMSMITAIKAAAVRVCSTSSLHHVPHLMQVSSFAPSMLATRTAPSRPIKSLTMTAEQVEPALEDCIRPSREVETKAK